MKMSDNQIKRLIKCIFDELKDQKLVTFKDDEGKVFTRGVELVQEEYAKERELDEEVHRMMDDLEAPHPGEFQRYKMFPLLKKKLAKEKGFVL